EDPGSSPGMRVADPGMRVLMATHSAHLVIPAAEPGPPIRRRHRRKDPGSSPGVRVLAATHSAQLVIPAAEPGSPVRRRQQREGPGSSPGIPLAPSGILVPLSEIFVARRGVRVPMPTATRKTAAPLDQETSRGPTMAGFAFPEPKETAQRLRQRRP